jgi:hypothetical protein
MQASQSLVDSILSVECNNNLNNESNDGELNNKAWYPDKDSNNFQIVNKNNNNNKNNEIPTVASDNKIPNDLLQTSTSTDSSNTLFDSINDSINNVLSSLSPSPPTPTSTSPSPNTNDYSSLKIDSIIDSVLSKVSSSHNQTGNNDQQQKKSKKITTNRKRKINENNNNNQSVIINSKYSSHFQSSSSSSSSQTLNLMEPQAFNLYNQVITILNQNKKEEKFFISIYKLLLFLFFYF